MVKIADISSLLINRGIPLRLIWTRFSTPAFCQGASMALKAGQWLKEPYLRCRGVIARHSDTWQEFSGKTVKAVERKLIDMASTWLSMCFEGDDCDSIGMLKEGTKVIVSTESKTWMWLVTGLRWSKKIEENNSWRRRECGRRARKWCNGLRQMEKHHQTWTPRLGKPRT